MEANRAYVFTLLAPGQRQHARLDCEKMPVREQKVELFPAWVNMSISTCPGLEWTTVVRESPLSSFLELPVWEGGGQHLPPDHRRRKNQYVDEIKKSRRSVDMSREMLVCKRPDTT